MQMAMGEAAPYLMPSVPHPLFASCGFKEGDRLRALTTSVSFGRFMNEPLDWEKWSSFSHNRTLEDVQKNSRPGAVAEKKAFFEAYYKNFAPKKGAKPPKKENIPPKFSDIDENKPNATNLGFSETGNVILSTCQVEQEKTSTENVSSPSTNLVSRNSGVKPEIASNIDVCLEIVNVDGVVSGTSQVEPSTDIVFSQFMDVKDDGASNTRGVEPEISSTEDVGLPSTNLVYSEIGNADSIISNASQVEHVKPSADIVFSKFVDVKEDMSRNNVEEPEISSNKDVGLPRTNLVFSENRNADDMITSSGQMEQDKTSTENVSLEKHQFQVEILNHVEENKKRQIKDKISMQTKTEISWVKSSSRKAAIAVKKAAIDLMGKKKSVLQSLHLSIKFHASLNKNLNLKTSSKPKDRSIQQALTRVSRVNVLKKNSQVLPIPENKSKTTIMKSLTTNHSQTLIASSKKPTLFSSFSFRSDERAAKRKEFFQKLEEKRNTNRTEKTQLQPKLKEKGMSDNRKLPWASVLQAKPKPSTSATKGPSNIIQKVHPKLGKKNFIEINKKNLSRSMACLASKKLHESALMLNK